MQEFIVCVCLSVLIRKMQICTCLLNGKGRLRLVLLSIFSPPFLSSRVRILGGYTFLNEPCSCHSRVK